MNDRQHVPETEFARRLGAELRTIVAERGAEAEAARTEEARRTTVAAWRRRGPRLATAGATLMAALVAVLIASAGGGSTSSAWAVKSAAGGEVNVTIRNLEDAKGLESALKQAGIPVTVDYKPNGDMEQTCKPSAPHDPVGVGILRRGNGGPVHFSIERGALAPGTTLEMTADPWLVFFSFTPRGGHEKAGVIKSSPEALLECRIHHP